MSNRDGDPTDSNALIMKPFGVGKLETPGEAQRHGQKEDFFYGGPRPRANVGRLKKHFTIDKIRGATVGLKLGPIDVTWTGRVRLDPRVVCRVSLIGTMEGGGGGLNSITLWSSILEQNPDTAFQVENIRGTRSAPVAIATNVPALATPDLQFDSFEVQASGELLEFVYRAVVPALSSIFINGTAWYFVVRYTPVEDLTDAEWESLSTWLNWVVRPTADAF
jgi:hypothetical protein